MHLVPATMAFVVTVAFVCALRPVAARVGLTDRPGGRKRHEGEVPIVGGIAMFLAVAVAATMTRTVEAPSYVVAAVMLLLVVGIVDDRSGIKPATRLAAQTLAALIVIAGGGLYLRDIGAPFGTGMIGLGAFAIPLSVVMTVTVINAFNFVDGIDGLAASMAAIALAAGAVVAGPAAPTAALAMAACGAILGFLLFNLPILRAGRLRTFMGDAGSTMLGLLVVCLTISISQGDQRYLSPVAALWFALMPLADFFSTFVRRIAQGRTPLSPGREHFHHILLRAGLGQPMVLAVLVGFALVYACVGLVGAQAGWPDAPMFTAWILLLAGQYFVIRRIAAWARLRRRARAVAVAGAAAGKT